MTLLDKLDINRNEIETYLEEMFLEDMDLTHHTNLKSVILDLVGSGGKRLRPALVITGARFGKRFEDNKKEIYRAAAMMEAIHISSLVHDDVIDRSDTRRHKPALNSKIGSRKAVFAGSYMFTRAVEILAEYMEYGYHSKINNGLKAMCAGEMAQLNGKFDLEIDINSYIKKSKAKTAQMIALCLYLGAAISGADTIIVRKLEKIGMYIGTAFQMIDDILDFTQDTKTLGKPSGSDLQNGNITLPLIYARKKIYKQIPQLDRHNISEHIEEIKKIIIDTGSIDKSIKAADKQLQKARELIGSVDDNDDGKKYLLIIIEYVLSRQY